MNSPRHSPCLLSLVDILHTAVKVAPSVGVCSKHLDIGQKLNCVQGLKCHAPCAPLAAGKPLMSNSFALSPDERLLTAVGLSLSKKKCC